MSNVIEATDAELYARLKAQAVESAKVVGALRQRGWTVEIEYQDYTYHAHSGNYRLAPYPVTATGAIVTVTKEVSP